MGNPGRPYPIIRNFANRYLGSWRVRCKRGVDDSNFLHAQRFNIKFLKRPPTTREWARLQKYARKMEILSIRAPLPVQVFSVLQFRTSGKSLLPNLEYLSLRGKAIAAETITFIPLFLSPRVVEVEFHFPTLGIPEAVVASMITSIPITCPSLERIVFWGLPRDPMIAIAISEIFTSNRALRSFDVNSPLTEEARAVLYELPNLQNLRTVIEGATSLPRMVLPNLTEMDIEFDDHRGLLQGFCGASLGMLNSLTFRSESESIGGFFEAFGRVALTTSIPTTLSRFALHTSRPWRPDYRPLLSFTQLTVLTIEFSCTPSCSSTVDDDTVADLARAMPKLKSLHLGKKPCRTPAGVTVKGLSAIAYYCSRLIYLRIHFRVASLDPPEIPFASASGERREDCALIYLDVGCIQISEESMLMVTSTLLRIFPSLQGILHSDEKWDKVAAVLRDSRSLANGSSKEFPACCTSTVFMIALSGPGARLIE